MSWVVRAPSRDLRKDEKKLYSRVRRVLWDYEPLRASHAEIFIDIELRWLQWARSCQFLDQLRTVSAAHDKQSGELSARLERLKRKFPLSANGHRR